MTTEKTNQNEIPQEPVERQYTEAEMKEMRERTLAFYKAELPHLKAQNEYQKLLADIEEHKVRRIKAIHQQAYIYQSMQEQGEQEEQPEQTNHQEQHEVPVDQETVPTEQPTEPIKRTLKKV